MRTMKWYLAALLVTFCGQAAWAQKKVLTPPDMPRNEENNQVYYMEVVPVDADVRELWKRGVIWYRQFYKNPHGVVESLDSVAGRIVLKPQFTAFREKKGVQVQAGVVKYTLVLAMRENRYRYEIKDINLKAASYYPIERLFDAKDPDVEDNYALLTEVHRYCTALIEDLKAAMKQPSQRVRTDDW